MKQAIIKVASVGCNFACLGKVIDSATRKVVSRTRLFPNGFGGSAQKQATQDAQNLGYDEILVYPV